MSLVSLTHRPKPAMSMDSIANFRRRTMNESMKNITEYRLFLLLEKKRVMKLRELYQDRSSNVPKTPRQSSHGGVLPKLPPRYQCLDLSVQWFISEISKQKKLVSVNNMSKDQWRALDHATKVFLQDVLHILREQLAESRSFSPRSRPPCAPSPSPSTITPPSSPLTLPQASSEDTILPKENETQARRGGKITAYPQGRRIEVDMTDDEIRSLWNRTVPSEDGIDFD